MAKPNRKTIWTTHQKSGFVCREVGHWVLLARGPERMNQWWRAVQGAKKVDEHTMGGQAG